MRHLLLVLVSIGNPPIIDNFWWRRFDTAILRKICTFLYSNEPLSKLVSNGTFGKVPDSSLNSYHKRHIISDHLTKVEVTNVFWYGLIVTTIIYYIKEKKSYNYLPTDIYLKWPDTKKVTSSHFVISTKPF